MTAPSTTPEEPADRVILAATADDMRALAERFAAALEPGDVLALVGPLGVGKTTFAQGLARGLAVPADRHVASPSFALVNEHRGRVDFVHADLYRIGDMREVSELGLDEAVERAVVAIEWADRFPGCLPEDHVRVEFTPTGSGARAIAFSARGPRSRSLIDRLRMAAPVG